MSIKAKIFLFNFFLFGLSLGSCSKCNKGNDKEGFSCTLEAQKAVVYIEDTDKVDLELVISSELQEAVNLTYRLVKYEILNNQKGTIDVGRHGAMRLGLNTISYKPKSVGEHTIKLFVSISSEDNTESQAAQCTIEVKDKQKTTFEISLSNISSEICDQGEFTLTIDDKGNSQNCRYKIKSWKMVSANSKTVVPTASLRVDQGNDISSFNGTSGAHKLTLHTNYPTSGMYILTATVVNEHGDEKTIDSTPFNVKSLEFNPIVEQPSNKNINIKISGAQSKPIKVKQLIWSEGLNGFAIGLKEGDNLKENNSLTVSTIKMCNSGALTEKPSLMVKVEGPDGKDYPISIDLSNLCAEKFEQQIKQETNCLSNYTIEKILKGLETDGYIGPIEKLQEEKNRLKKLCYNIKNSSVFLGVENESELSNKIHDFDERIEKFENIETLLSYTKDKKLSETLLKADNKSRHEIVEKCKSLNIKIKSSLYNHIDNLLNVKDKDVLNDYDKKKINAIDALELSKDLLTAEKVAQVWETKLNEATSFIDLYEEIEKTIPEPEGQKPDLKQKYSNSQKQRTSFCTKINDLKFKEDILRNGEKTAEGTLFKYLKEGKDTTSILNLLNNKQLDISARDNDEQSFLEVLAKANNNRSEQDIKQLCEALKNKKLDLTKVDQKGNSILHTATIANNEAMIEALIDWGVDVNQKNINDQTALHLSTDPTIIKSLIEHKTQFLRDKEGKYPIHTAASLGNINALQTLLGEKNAENNPGVTDFFGNSPLHYAKNKETVEILLKKDASLKESTNKEGQTPLHCAAKNGNKEVIESLLKQNLQIDKQDNYLKTSLHYAIESGHTEVAEILLKAKANVNSQDSLQRTALHYASSANSVKILVNNGASISSTDNKGQTSLHTAAQNGYADVAEQLIKEQAIKNKEQLSKLIVTQDFIDFKDKEGKRAIDLTKDNKVYEAIQKYDNKDAIAQLLHNTGMSPNSVLSAQDWKMYFGCDVGEVPVLPKNIEDILNGNCPYCPGKKIKDTHMLVLIPKTVNQIPLTTEQMINTVNSTNGKNPCRISVNQSMYLPAELPIENSYWMLIKKDGIPDNIGKNSKDKNQLLNNGGSMPRVIEAVASIIMYYKKTGNCMYSKRATICEGDNNSVTVGPFCKININKPVALLIDMLGINKDYKPEINIGYVTRL